MDTHLHSDISFDSDAPMAQMVQACLDAGVREMCFTEHMDYGNPDTDDFISDLTRYRRVYEQTCRRFPGVSIGYGLELGYYPAAFKAAQAHIAGERFDHVILSAHAVDGVDPYFGGYFQGKDRRTAYGAYLAVVDEMLGADFDGFTSVGHITYVAKYAPFRPQPCAYREFPALFDHILTQIIRRGKALEINTSSLAVYGAPSPGWDVAARYRQLGGRLICLGSDAHQPDRAGLGFRRAQTALRQIGFTELFTFKNMQPVPHKL